MLIICNTAAVCRRFSCFSFFHLLKTVKFKGCVYTFLYLPECSCPIYTEQCLCGTGWSERGVLRIVSTQRCHQDRWCPQTGIPPARNAHTHRAKVECTQPQKKDYKFTQQSAHFLVHLRSEESAGKQSSQSFLVPILNNHNLEHAVINVHKKY